MRSCLYRGPRRPAFGAASRCFAVGSMLSAATFFGCGSRAEPELQDRPPPKITIARPLERKIEQVAEFAGWTEPAEKVEMRAPVDGFLIDVEAYSAGKTMAFVEGSAVKSGALLFVIARESQHIARWYAAEAACRQVRAQLELPHQGEVKTPMDVLRADLETAQSQLDEIRRQLGCLEIRAPIDGVIGRRRMGRGNLVSGRDGTLLSTIRGVDPIHVVFPLDEPTALRLLRQQRDEGGLNRIGAAFGLADEKPYSRTARLDLIEVPSEPSTGKALARAVARNLDGRIPSGISVRVRLTIGSASPALLVEPTGVGTDPGGAYVLVYTDQHTLEQRYVDLGAVHNGMRVVLNRRDRDAHCGLNPEEYYVVKGLARARPGQPVQVETKDASGNGPGSKDAKPPEKQ